MIFLIAWQHQVSISTGKESKDWSEKGETENHVLLKNGWKPSQKMRLDALIIFLIEWRHQVSISRGKWSKYWSWKGETENHVLLRMAGNIAYCCEIDIFLTKTLFIPQLRLALGVPTSSVQRNAEVWHPVPRPRFLGSPLTLPLACLWASLELRFLCGILLCLWVCLELGFLRGIARTRVPRLLWVCF